MTTHYCLLKKFNNYFNRKIIKYESLEDYKDHSEEFFIPTGADGNALNFNFNPNDNVTTEIIVNDLEFYPDYFLLLDYELNILERWFILEQRRNAKGQWVYYLKRDVIADNFNSLLNAPVFVEKGMLHEDDPFIVNDEGMGLNQIKKNEIRLLDKSKTAWIVGYIAKNAGAVDIEAQDESVDVDAVSLSQIASEIGLTEGTLFSLLNTSDEINTYAYVTTKVSMGYYLAIDTSFPYLFDIYQYYRSDFNSDFSDGNGLYIGEGNAIQTSLFYYAGQPSVSIQGGMANMFTKAVIDNKNDWINHINEIFERNYYLSDSDLNVLKKYNGKYILYNGEYYIFNISEVGNETNRREHIKNNGANLALTDTVNRTIMLMSGYVDLNTRPTEELNNIELSEKKIALSIRQATVSENIPAVKTTISTSRKTTEDQEFDIFAIPLNIFINTGSETFETIEMFSRKMASEIARKLDANMYDIQLLPYCPIPQMLTNDNEIDVSNLTEDVDYSLIKYISGDDENNCGIVFYIRNATFKAIVEQEINIDKSKKVVSNCYMWRLNSPNYQGAFDFNIAKNGGKVAYFNVFCTYKPFTPVIKVAPNFDWLYGNEYQDNRGLICGGDFSLPRVSDEFIRYQLNNKNYQNIFNRDIQHLDFMQSIEMRNQIVSGAVGIFSDSAKGAGAGAMVGGPWGAVAGGIIGGATSAIGFGIDVDTMARTHRENKQLAIDKFNYQLGNIKALPYTLTKVGSFDVISKLFPFVEEYVCSEAELEAFEKKIKYESMTVMRIGTLSEFRSYEEELHYFKGSLIRNDEIADDPHTLNAIYEEFLKGVYI